MTAFSVELERALTRRGMLPTHVARQAGVTLKSLRLLRHGETVATARTAESLAHVLDWPSLVDRGLADRTGICPMCQATFVWNPPGRHRRHCVRCTGDTRRRQKREALRTRVNADTRLIRNRLNVHQSAVAAFCFACTLGEGLCRDAVCPLRPVSPLPLAKARAVA